MKPTGHLFTLIRSMSRAEKRSFKLYARRYNKAANYLRLFDAIDRQEEYDEEDIRRRFAGERFIDRLTATKDYLYDMILRSLCEQHEGETPEQRVLALYRRADVLVNRRLYTQAEKLIAKAKALCRHYELFEELGVILNLEAYLPWVDRAALFAETQQMMDCLNTNFAYGLFAERLRAMSEGRRIVRTAAEKAELHAIVQSCPHASAEDAPTFGAGLRYWFGYAHYYSLLGKAAQANRCHKEIVDLFHAHPQFIETNTLAYLSEVRMVYAVQIAGADYDDAAETIERFRAIDVPPRFVPFREILLFFMEQQYRRSTVQLGKLEHLRRRYAELGRLYPQEMRSYGVNMHIHITMNFASMYFLAGRYARALAYLNALLDDPSLGRYPAVENNAKIMVLIVHYELGHTELVQHLLRSTYRFLLKRERLFAFERCVLRYLRRLSSVHGERELRRWFRELYEAVNALADDPLERKFLQRSDYLDWLKGRLPDTVGAGEGAERTKRRPPKVAR